MEQKKIMRTIRITQEDIDEFLRTITDAPSKIILTNLAQKVISLNQRKPRTRKIEKPFPAPKPETLKAETKPEVKPPEPPKPEEPKLPQPYKPPESTAEWLEKRRRGLEEWVKGGSTA